jgi:ABC-type nitrate/sulfonate/bicarbonate transport system substrate-binding protein
MSTRMLLSQRGLDPNGVAYTALGPGAGRLAAVQSGAVAAAVLSITDVEQLKRNDPKGHQIVDIASDVRMLFNGLATTDKLLKEEPAMVAGFLRATLKGREYFKQYKDESLDIVGKYNNQPRDLTEPVYRSILPAMTADGTTPAESQATDSKVRAALIGATAVRPIAEVYDYALASRIGRELRQSGWTPTR